MWHASIHTHFLEFITPAKTSRGTYQKKEIKILKIRLNGKEGSGEISPLPDLSIDAHVEFENILPELTTHLNNQTHLLDLLNIYSHFPSFCFGLECAFQDYLNGGHGKLFNNPFTEGRIGIPINGLIWMNQSESMFEEGLKKWKEGYKCLKVKIGSLDFDEECRLLEKLRKMGNAFKLELRVDANGAFDSNEALIKLHELKRFQLHSIEQPVKPGQWDLMEELCAKSPVKIALDEELIGSFSEEKKYLLLIKIKPHYLVLKPTLIGGFTHSQNWIEQANSLGINWWVTSALESNIGLSAIAQWIGNFPVQTFHGLGTGMLFTKNFPAKFSLQNGTMYYQE